MKKFNLVKKFASLALVTSLFVGTLAPTALAVVRPDGKVPRTLTKTMQMKDGVSVKESFTFEIEPTTEGPKPNNQKPAPEGLVKLEKNSTDPTKVYTDGTSDTLNLVYDTAMMEQLANKTDPDTKVYRVKITEKKGNRDGMIYDESIKYMDIYVWYGTVGKYTNTFYKTVIYDKDGNKLAGLDFKNGYGKNPGNDPTPNDKVKELKVNKVLKKADGTESTDTKEFDVTINIKGQVGDIFTYNGQTYEITEANEADGVYIDAKIKNKGTLTIDGLTDNDKVKVSESAEIKKTYTVTGELTKDTLVKDIENQTVTITNKEKIVIPTGLLNTIAPFILIIGLAGGLGFVYFKKNKNELA